MYHKYHHFFVILSTCCLLFLMTACSLFPSSPTTTGSTPTASTTQGKTPTSTGGTATATTATMPPTQNTCPATGTARAEVRAPLALGTHQTIVYIFNQGTQDAPTSGIIRRFDARTGLKTDIVNIPGSLIYEAQISADGQWVLFTSKMAGQMALQMVRMDGKGIQTLHCAAKSLFDVQWSPDQKSLVFFEGADLSSASVMLLTLANGTLQTELLPPAQGSKGAIGASPRTWLDNTHIYMTGFVANSDAPPQDVYILDTAKGANQHYSDLQKIIGISGRCYDLDTSFDNSKLLLSQCKGDFNPSVGVAEQGPSSITTQPALGGGTQNSIYSSATLAVTTMRVISSTTLLLVIGNTVGDMSKNGLWKMHTDGSGLTRLSTDTAGHFSSLNGFTQLTWANVSRDGTLYAVKSSDAQQTNQNLLVGTLSGSSPATFAAFSGTGSISVVGWTTM